MEMASSSGPEGPPPPHLGTTSGTSAVNATGNPAGTAVEVTNIPPEWPAAHLTNKQKRNLIRDRMRKEAKRAKLAAAAAALAGATQSPNTEAAAGSSPEHTGVSTAAGPSEPPADYSTPPTAALAADLTMHAAAEACAQQQHTAIHYQHQQAAHNMVEGVLDSIQICDSSTKDTNNDGNASDSGSEGRDSNSSSFDNLNNTALGTELATDCDSSGAVQEAVQEYYSAESQVLHAAAFPSRPGSQLCAYFAKTGHCKFGEQCTFDHPGWHQVALTAEGLPFRPGQPLCTYYFREGRCKFGPCCKFHHPKLASIVAQAAAQQQQQQQGDLPQDALLGSAGMHGMPAAQQDMGGESLGQAAAAGSRAPLKAQAAALRVILGGVLGDAAAASGVSVSGPAAAAAAAAAAVSATRTAPAGAAAMQTPADQALHATMQAVSAAADVLLALGQPLPTVAEEDHNYSNWQIVAEATAVQRLVKMYCSAVEVLLTIKPEHSKPFCSLAIQQDVPEAWQPESRPQQLHGMMLLSYSGHMLAYSLLEPASLRKRLTRVTKSAISSRSGLRGWFWLARDVLVDEWASPACRPPGKYRGMEAGVVLQQCVMSRVHLAHLLIEAYKLLRKGSAHLLPVEL